MSVINTPGAVLPDSAAATAGVGTGSRGAEPSSDTDGFHRSARPSLEGADDQGGDPVAVEVAGLRDDLLAVDGTEDKD